MSFNGRDRLKSGSKCRRIFACNNSGGRMESFDIAGYTGRTAFYSCYCLDESQVCVCAYLVMLLFFMCPTHTEDVSKR